MSGSCRWRHALLARVSGRCRGLGQCAASGRTRDRSVSRSEEVFGAWIGVGEWGSSEGGDDRSRRAEVALCGGGVGGGVGRSLKGWLGGWREWASGGGGGGGSGRRLGGVGGGRGGCVLWRRMTGSYRWRQALLARESGRNQGLVQCVSEGRPRDPLVTCSEGVLGVCVSGGGWGAAGGEEGRLRGAGVDFHVVRVGGGVRGWVGG